LSALGAAAASVINAEQPDDPAESAALPIREISSFSRFPAWKSGKTLYCILCKDY